MVYCPLTTDAPRALSHLWCLFNNVRSICECRPKGPSWQVELKASRLRLREESLKFKRDRFESWKKLMEKKGKQKEYRANVQVQLEREKLELRREQLSLKKKDC